MVLPFAGNGATESSISEAVLSHQTLLPRSSFCLSGARRGASPGPLPRPGRGDPAFPVCRRHIRLVWRGWACRAGPLTLNHGLRLLLHGASSHSPDFTFRSPLLLCLRRIRVTGHLV